MQSNPQPDPARTAIVLIAHGSRNDEANADAFYFAGSLRSEGVAELVEPAFLELAKPDIPTAVAMCAREGVEEIVLLPYFLSAGVHVQNDLAEFCLQFQERYPKIHFTLAEPLGRHPLLLDVLKERVRLARTLPPRPG